MYETIKINMANVYALKITKPHYGNSMTIYQ